MTSEQSSHDAYAACRTELGEDADPSLFLRCVSTSIHEHQQSTMAMLDDYKEFTRTLYIILASALVFFMQAGFAMVCAGSVRRKNLQNTMLKNILDACWASVGFFCFGYAFAFGRSSNGWIGTTGFFLNDVDDLAFWLFQYTFSAATATIVAGTLAERCKMGAYIAYSIFLTSFVYPIVAHAFWNQDGFLSTTSDNPLFGVGVVDFAGSGVVHLTGGTVALIATWILGPRRGRFHDEMTGEPLLRAQKIPGHSVSLQMVGTLILWFCWYGFNSGSALILPNTDFQNIIAALAASNTTLSAGTAGIVSLMTNMIAWDIKEGRAFYDLNPALNGVLSGLVAITGCCGVVEPWAAMVVGIFAGWIYLVGSWALEKLRLDDAVNGIPIHMLNGIWGLLAVGIFADPARLEQAYGDHANHKEESDGTISRHPSGVLISILEGAEMDTRILRAQIVGIICILCWTTAIMFPFFLILGRFGFLRSLARDEMVGLDHSMHGGTTTTDLTIQQLHVYQTLIKEKMTTDGSVDQEQSLSSSEIRNLKQKAKQIVDHNEQERMEQINELNPEDADSDGDLSSSTNSPRDDSSGGFQRVSMTGEIERR